jgi:hypothetical protein
MGRREGRTLVQPMLTARATLPYARGSYLWLDSLSFPEYIDKTKFAIYIYQVVPVYVRGTKIHHLFLNFLQNAKSGLDTN